MAIQSDLEDTIDVVESTRSVRVCMNITDGYLERTSAYIYHSTSSGSATGIIIEINDVLTVMSFALIFVVEKCSV